MPGIIFLIMEIWKDVPGYSGLYQVSNLGRVVSLKYGRHILKSCNDSYGYPIVVLCNGTKKKTKTVHRLVAMAFVPNPENKPEIDHINTIRDDNRPDNLRWVTRKENANNPLSIAKYKRMEHIYTALSKRRKPILQYLDGNVIARYDSIRDAERQTGISHQNISSVLRGRCIFAGGYHWEYEERPKTTRI